MNNQHRRLEFLERIVSAQAAAECARAAVAAREAEQKAFLETPAGKAAWKRVEELLSAPWQPPDDPGDENKWALVAGLLSNDPARRVAALREHGRLLRFIFWHDTRHRMLGPDPEGLAKCNALWSLAIRAAGDELKAAGALDGAGPPDGPAIGPEAGTQ